MVNALGTDTDIPIRLSHVEVQVEHLSEQFGKMQATLQVLVSQSNEQRIDLRDIAAKLDITRTAKPNFGMLVPAGISFATLIIIIGGLTFAPVYRGMNDARAERKNNESLALANVELVIDTRARLGHVEIRQQNVEDRVLITESGSFTKQDAQHLETELRREIEALRK